MPNYISPLNHSIIISSKIKIFRNIEGFNFVKALSEEEKEKLSNLVLCVLKEKNILKNFYIFNFKNGDVKEIFYKENKFFKKEKEVTFEKNREFNLFLNEEEHIGIECTNSGLSLKKLHKKVNFLDDLIEEKVKYSFDFNFGYLTSNLKNIGAALKAEVFIHLPLLRKKNLISLIRDSLYEEGFALEEVYEPLKNGFSNIYTLYNINSFRGEEDILESITAITNKLALREKNERNRLSDEEYKRLNQDISESLSFLKKSDFLKEEEALRALSYVRLGVEMGIIDCISLKDLNYANMKIHPKIIKYFYGDEKVEYLNKKRAEIIKRALNT